MKAAPRAQLVVWFATWGLLQLVFITVPTWLRAHAFGFSNYDFGIYSQAISRLALDPPNPWLSGRQLFLFNDHFDPILFLTVPFAKVLPGAEVGLGFEALAALSSLLALGWLMNEGRLSLRAGWLLGGLLALGVGVTQALGFPVHPTTWAMAPMAWLLAALLLERWSVAMVALVLLFACKEEFPFVGLALAPYLFTRAPRRVAWAMTGLSLAWAVFAFVLRPRWFGDVMPYTSVPFRGAERGVLEFFAMRLSPGVLAGLGDLVVAFVPVAAWLAWTRQAPRRELLLVLAPLLGVRFFAMAWRDHYGAVVVAAAVLVVAALLDGRTPPGWVLISTFALLIITNEQPLRRTVKALRGVQGWAASTGCSDPPGRVEAIARGLAAVRHAPGPLFVSGNLLPWLAERDDVYAFGGPQPSTLAPRTVLLERPPCGDTWAMSLADREALYAAWKGNPRAVPLVVEDAVLAVQLR